MLPRIAELAAPKSYGQLEGELMELLEAQPELQEFVFREWEPRRWRKRPGRTRHYPQQVIPIHPIPPPKRRPEDDTATHSRRHWRRIRELVRTVEKDGAGAIPPILVHRGQLITGTHRWVANELLERRGRTEARIRVLELETYPPLVQFVIRTLFNAGRTHQDPAGLSPDGRN